MMEGKIKKISSTKIILMGELIVNLPVTIVILATGLIINKFGLDWNLSLILGSILGWFCWEKLVDKWKTWALNQNVDKERLFRLGKLGLINFYRHKIFGKESK